MGLTVPPEFPHHPVAEPIGSWGTGAGARPRPRPGHRPWRSPLSVVATVVVLVLMGVVLRVAVGVMSSDGDPTVTGPAVAVDGAAGPFEDGAGRDRSGVVAPRLGPPEDATWSQARIREAFTTAFDATVAGEVWMAAVDAPLSSHDRLAGLAGRCGSVVATVDAVEFTSPDDAVVRFRLVGSTVPGGDRATIDGGAARRDGTWKVTGFTVDAVVDAAEATCP